MNQTAKLPDLKTAAPALAAAVAVLAGAALAADQHMILLGLAGIPFVVAAFLHPVLGLMGMMVFIPLEGFGSIAPGSFTLPRLIGFVTFACFAANSLARRKAIRFDLTAKLLGMLVTWFFLSGLWATDAETTYSMSFVVFQLFLFYVMSQNLLHHPQALRYALLAYIFGCAIASMWALKNYQAGEFSANLQRVSAVDDMNPNDFARMIGFGLLAGIYLLFDDISKWSRNAVLFAFPLLFFGLALSKSRGAWVAFVLALAVIFWLVKKTPKVMMAAGLVATLIFGTVAAGIHFGYFNESFEQRFEQTTDGKNPTAERADIWKVGLALFRDNPIVGVGFYNFKTRFNDYLHVVKTDVFPGFNKDPHNIFLAVLGETGMVGFALFGGIFAVLIARLWRAPPTWAVHVATAMLAFTTVAGLSASDHIRKWFWVSLVVVYLLSTRRAKPMVETEKEQDASSHRQPDVSAA